VIRGRLRKVIRGRLRKVIRGELRKVIRGGLRKHDIQLPLLPSPRDPRTSPPPPRATRTALPPAPREPARRTAGSERFGLALLALPYPQRDRRPAALLGWAGHRALRRVPRARAAGRRRAAVRVRAHHAAAARRRRGPRGAALHLARAPGRGAQRAAGRVRSPGRARAAGSRFTGPLSPAPRAGPLPVLVLRPNTPAAPKHAPPPPARRFQSMPSGCTCSRWRAGRCFASRSAPRRAAARPSRSNRWSRCGPRAACGACRVPAPPGLGEWSWRLHE